ncbi:YvrJ family protein [Bacillus sp. RS11]|uniref:YvrJ family protein n=1 Tax=Lysinibacillus sp. RS11 TaxID=3242682 RepID=UPI0035C6C128
MITTEDIPMWITLTGNFGFPIAITVYLFVRFEKKLDKLELVILQLSEVIKTVNNRRN